MHKVKTSSCIHCFSKRDLDCHCLSDKNMLQIWPESNENLDSRKLTCHNSNFNFFQNDLICVKSKHCNLLKWNFNTPWMLKLCIKSFLLSTYSRRNNRTKSPKLVTTEQNLSAIFPNGARQTFHEQGHKCMNVTFFISSWASNDISGDISDKSKKLED